MADTEDSAKLYDPMNKLDGATLLRVLPWLQGDTGLLLGARTVRSFIFGYLQVILAIYLTYTGLSALEIGILFAAEIVVASFLMVAAGFIADRYGRKRVLLFSGLFMILMGVIFSVTTDLRALILGAGLAGILAGPSATPFAPTEQAVVAGKVGDQVRTTVFSTFFFVGAVSTTIGTLLSALPALLMDALGLSLLESYRPLFLLMVVGGAVTVILILRLKEEPLVSRPKTLLSRKSSGRMTKLAISLSLDGLGEGFFVPFYAFFFFVRFGTEPATLGPFFAVGEILNAIGLLIGGRLARRMGLVNATVLSRLPVILLSAALPFGPTFTVAIVLFTSARLFASMDVPLVQSYTMAVIDETERASVAGVVSMSKRLAAAGGPGPAGYLFAQSLLTFPFVIGSIIQGVSIGSYFLFFRKIRPPEEVPTV